jgi:signal transduction histidine kinase/CheY-like chemotaxis protein
MWSEFLNRIFSGDVAGTYGEQYVRAALIVSLLSVWLLVGLFYYINRYTKRDYFTMWTAAWLFYALWLTLSLQLSVKAGFDAPGGFTFLVKHFCVAISAVFLLWGSLRFLQLPVRQTLIGLFMLFLMAWTFVGPQVGAVGLQLELPVFILLGSGSVFAGVCFYRIRRRMPFVGAGMLSLGFLLWGIFLASFPLSQEFGKKYENLYSASYFVAAVLQLFIAVSMIVLVLEEVRYKSEQVFAEIAQIRSEKEALQAKVLTTEEQYRNLYSQVLHTEGKQKAYDELRQAQQALVRQERLRALGEMSSGVAHDINNLLSPVVAYSELLLDQLPNLEERPRRYLNNIHKAAQDIAQIVARMREFYRSRSSHEQLTAVNFNQVIEDVIELTRPRWRDLPQRDGISINLKRELGTQLPVLMSDASELREALTNLVFNAVDALPQGGTITFATRCESQPAGNAAKPGGHKLIVEVRDDGMGMSEEIRQRCLEPFFSTKAQRGGSGLGLAMVYGMIQRHEGNIEVESALGKGTCMRLVFPVRESTIDEESTASVNPEKTEGLRVLCIDDEPNVRELVADCLGGVHKIETAPTGKAGLEMFRSGLKAHQPYDVVITDLGMPEVDGHQVAREVKSDSPDTPIILLTGWGTMMKQDGETIGHADAIVGKPPSMKDLNDLIVRLNAKRCQGAAQPKSALTVSAN